jgi:Na+/proline symporter
MAKYATTAIVLGIGAYFFRRARQSTGDFWIAGGEISLKVQVFAFFAAAVSAGSFFGIGGLAYQLGLGAMIVLVGSVIAGLMFIMVFIAAPMRRAGVYTVPDYLKMRYDSTSVRFVAAVLFAVFAWAYLVPQLTAGGITMDFVIPWFGYEGGVIAAFVIFALYITLGGMWAITWTDFVQGLMIILLAVLPLPIIFADFGVSGVLSAALQADPGFGGTKAPGLMHLGLMAVWIFAPLGLPYFGQRILSSDTDRTARHSIMWMNAIYFVVFLLGMIFISAAAVAIEPNLANSDYFYYAVLVNYTGPFIQGLGAAALLAAAMSTTDALLLAMSASVSHDLPQTLDMDLSERQETWLGTATMWIGGLIAAVVALDPPNIIALMVTLVGGAAASGFFPALAIGTWWKRANAYGAIAAMLIGTAVYGGLLFGEVMPAPFTEALVGIPAGVLSLVIVSLVTAEPGEIEAENFRQFHRPQDLAASEAVSDVGEPADD